MSNVSNVHMKQKSDIRVVRTWRNNHTSSTILFTIPHQLARQYHLDEPTNLLMIPTDNGILLKKLEMETMK